MLFAHKFYIIFVMIKIQKNIPLPKEGRGRKTLYDFDSMNVGDSFFAEDLSKQTSILTCALKFKPKKFITQTVTEKEKKGIRCWRIE